MGVGGKQGLAPSPQDVFCYCAIVHSSVLGINILVLAIYLILAFACSIGPKGNYFRITKNLEVSEDC